MFPATLTRDHGHIRRILIVALATLMLFATLATLPNGIPAADAAEDKAVNYIIVFDNGTTIRGESASGSWDVEVPGTGMAVHMSCSDTFGNVLGGNETYEFWGWSDAWSGYSVSPAHAGGTGHPNPDDDSNWRIADYAFWRPDSSGGKCGNQNLRTPSIDIEKATNGFDADDPTGPQVVVGSTVTWTYVVTNTGNVPLSSVVVSDNVINDATISGPVGDVGADGILGLDEIWTYTATGIAIEGQYANNGSVEGYSGDTKVIDDDDSHYYGVPAPTLTLIKNVINTGGGTADASEWTLIAAPTDNGGFFGHGGPATGTVATLGPNPVIAGVEYTLSESGGPSRYIAGQWSCEISSPLLQDEIASSAISVTTGNKITLENGETGVCTIKNTYNPPPPPRLAKLTVVKNTIGADGEFWFLTGSGLSDFSIATSSNTGSQSFILNAGTYTVAEDLSKLAEFWSFEGPVVCTGATESSFTGASATVQLDPGDSATCTFTNKYTPPVPAIEIEKATNGWDADLPTDPDVPTITAGFPVTWTYVVTNVGDVDLTNVTVTDNKEDFICTIDLLKVGESEECTKEGVAGVVDYGNVGTAVGFYGETQVTDEDLSHYKGEFVAGTAQLGDTVWLDANNNGKQDNGEVGYNGAKVILTDANGNVVGTLTTATGAWVGFYKFLELDAGVYTATLDLSTIGDYGVTTAKSFKVTLAEGDDYVDADFGLYKAEELPETGTDSEALVLLALGLLMMGGLAVLATSKRRSEES